MAGLLDNLATGLGAVYGFNKGISDVQDVGSRALQRAETAATDVAGQTQFKPFTVTSGIGGVSTTPTGGLTTTLTPEQQALQEQLQGFGTQAFGMLSSPEQRAQEQSDIISMLTQDPSQRASREQEMYNRLRAVQQPEEARKALELEERLFNQGRSGVQTAMYGGTPEQLAQAKAVEEAKAAASLGAIEQAGLEQYRQSEQTLAGLGETRERMGLFGDLGIQSLVSSYLPQQQLLNILAPAIDISNIASAGQRQGAQLGSSLIQAGLTSQLGAETAASNLRQQQIQAITNLLGGQRANTETGVTEQTGLLQSIIDRIQGDKTDTSTVTPTPSGSGNLFENLVNQGYFGSLG